MCVLCQGASVHRREEISGWTPLHAAAFAAKNNVLAQLVAHGAALESLDHAGECLDDARFLTKTTRLVILMPQGSARQRKAAQGSARQRRAAEGRATHQAVLT